MLVNNSAIEEQAQAMITHCYNGLVLLGADRELPLLSFSRLTKLSLLQHVAATLQVYCSNE